MVFLFLLVKTPGLLSMPLASISALLDTIPTSLETQFRSIYTVDISHEFQDIFDSAVTKSNGRNLRVALLFLAVWIDMFIFYIIWKYRSRKNYQFTVQQKFLKDKIKADRATLQYIISKQDKLGPLEIKNINKDTRQTILNNLAVFEKSELYLKKDITLSWLAKHIDTNTKYLSKIIKTHKEKNFRAYINRLRIEYITNKLDEESIYREYKINYLAKVAGYGSSQVFVIAFKKHTGITPSQFLENLKRTSERSNI